MAADHLRSGLARTLHRRFVIVDDEADVPSTVRRLRPACLERDELVAEVDEGHVPAPPAKLQLAKDPLEELECLVDRAHLDCDVVDAHWTCHGTSVAAAV